MQTIIIVLDAEKMTNPDLDIRYTLSDCIEEYTNGAVKDNGHDYISDTKLGIWLETADAENNAKNIAELIKTEKFLDNDLSKAADIYIAETECADIENCRKFYPL